MSTSAFDPGLSGSLPASWPDIETLTRLANEFFSAKPGDPVVGHAPAGPTASGHTAAAPEPAPSELNADVPLGRTAPSPVHLPVEADLKSFLDAIPVSPFAPPSGVPHPPSGPVASVAPSFYFLEHAGIGPVTPQPGASAPQTSLHGFSGPFDAAAIRRDFPILEERVNGRPLVWLDNAATTQKPRAVIDRLTYFYEHENSNIHRAAHELAARATDAYEAARDKVRGFLNAGSSKEIVFVRGATEAINLVAQSWGRQNIGKDDEIVVSTLEHHANIVPWQQLATEKGAKLRVIPVDNSGQLLLDEYGKLLNSKTKLVAFTHVSNALGTITPARQIIEAAHSAGARVLLDGAQSVSHMAVDVQALNPDWFVFSGHKVFAPTGIGVLYGKEDLLNETQPWQGGGNMIQDVTFERTIYQAAPARFEAGTGNIADAVGLGAAIDYVQSIGLDRIAEYEHQLLLYALRFLKEIPGLRLIGAAADPISGAHEKAGVISFVIDGYRTEDVGSALNREGIAVRSGHHCAQPILRRFGVESSVRPSLAVYNTCADIDALISALLRTTSQRRHF